MTRRLLLLSYWFPPTNIIGASRAVAMARFFCDQGWEVTVICADSEAASRDFSADISNIAVHRVTNTAVTRFLNFKTGRKQWVRIITALMRYGAFPDAFRTTVQRMERVGKRLIACGERFDVILSTALPFSQHKVAERIARQTGALLVLDNRDTWACNAYRRRLPFLNWIERRYEYKTLSNANLITAISDGMAQHYRDAYPDLADRVITIRNGVDRVVFTGERGHLANRSIVRVVYTGILYGKKRNIRPVLEAAQQASVQIAFDFYGSETNIIAEFRKQFPELGIVDHGRVSRQQAIDKQHEASVLLVALGADAVDRDSLPGKFFEYVGTGRPIIAIADEDYEISRIIDEFNLGIASRDPDRLAAFLSILARGEMTERETVPKPLTRTYQLALLEEQILTKLNEGWSVLNNL